MSISKPSALRGATLCSGIGAPETAWPWVDWRWCAEIEKFPSAVLAQRHPGSLNLGDITKPDFIARAQALGPLDVLVAGTPCQAFSIAGNRGSLSDERGNLTLRFVEIVDAIQPRFILWENVPGVLSTKDNAFGCFLGALAGTGATLVPGRNQRWTHCGVVDGPKRRIAWRILDAQWFGVAQRRERMFVVASLRDEAHPGEVLLECARLFGDHPPRRETRKDVTGTLSARTQGGGGLGTDFELDGGGGGVICEQKAMCDSRMHRNGKKQGGNGIGGEKVWEPMPQVSSTGGCHDEGENSEPSLRKLRMGQGPLRPSQDRSAGGLQKGEHSHPMPELSSPRESPHIGYPVAGLSNGDISHCLNAGGMGRIDYETETLVTHALTAEGFDASEDGTGRGSPLGPVAMIRARAQESHEHLVTAFRTSGNCGPYDTGDKTGALTTGTDQSAHLIAFDTTQITSTANYSNPKDGDPCHPLAATAHPPALAFRAAGQDGFRPAEVSPPIAESDGGGSGVPTVMAFNLRGREDGAMPEVAEVASLRSPSGGSSRSYLASDAAWAVRRLTPVECERLQSFPDHFTDVLYNGKQAADGPRYKSLGNSMNVNVIRWIGNRLRTVMESKCTTTEQVNGTIKP